MEHNQGANACIWDDRLVLPAPYISLDEILTIIPAEGTGDERLGVHPDPNENGRSCEEKKAYNDKSDATGIRCVGIGRDAGRRVYLSKGVQEIRHLIVEAAVDVVEAVS